MAHLLEDADPLLQSRRDGGPRWSCPDRRPAVQGPVKAGPPILHAEFAGFRPSQVAQEGTQCATSLT